MIISDLDHLEITTKSSFVEGGISLSEINTASINQISIAISYGGQAIAIASASISQSNTFFSSSRVHSKSWAISL